MLILAVLVTGESAAAGLRLEQERDEAGLALRLCDGRDVERLENDVSEGG